MLDISLRAAVNAYFCYMFGGMLRRAACAIRPYEVEAGATDRAVERSLGLLETTFRYDRDKLDAVKRVVAEFEQIRQQRHQRPQVAIFGDLYVRDNEVMNQALVRTIENNGGEVITTPYNEYVKIIANLYFRRWLREGRYLNVIKNRPLLATVEFLEKKYADEFSRLVPTTINTENELRIESILEKFKISPYHTGESLDNLLKIFHLLDANPEIALFVQTSPAFCCPSLITEAMAGQIEQITGVPIVNVTYDGTCSPKNDVVIPYLKLSRRRAANSTSIEIQ
jgi:predicted nucleotide-binding protein (sugar kinase/HSP70/actin superfamily)